jgi:hypothetical protein
LKLRRPASRRINAALTGPATGLPAMDRQNAAANIDFTNSSQRLGSKPMPPEARHNSYFAKAF